MPRNNQLPQLAGGLVNDPAAHVVSQHEVGAPGIARQGAAVQPGGASGPVSLVGSGQLESIPLCVRIQKTNPAASSLALGARALSVTDPALFSIAVQ